jgi:parvulin-like peptidyl-prolyl isomerase
MRNKLVIFFLLFLFSVFSVFSQEVVDRPVAIVKLYRTEVISSSKFNRTVEIFESQSGQSLSREDKMYLLDNMIWEILIIQAAENDDITVSEDDVVDTAMNTLMAQTGMTVSREEFRAIIEEQGVDFDQYVDYLRRQMIVEMYVMHAKQDNFNESATPTDAEIQTFFENNSQEFINPTMIRISHIFFPTYDQDASALSNIRSQAESAYRRIQGGASFEDVMKTVPLAADSPVQHGDLGYAARGNPDVTMIFGEDFMNRIFGMDVGDIGLVQSRIGYHIVKITDYRERTFLNLDDPVSPNDQMTVREYIYNIILQNKIQMVFQQCYQEVIVELTDMAEIQKFEDNL